MDLKDKWRNLMRSHRRERARAAAVKNAGAGTKIFQHCDSFRATKLNSMRGLDLISFSMPKHHSSLLNKNAVPVTAILHGTHEINLHTVQAMFGRIEGFRAVWTPIDYGPGTMYRAFEDHPMYKTFLETSSTLQYGRQPARQNDRERFELLGIITSL